MKPSTLTAVIETVRRLRAPGGCPWDIKQTHQSLRPYLIEEAYEVLDVLDQIDSTQNLKDAKIQGQFKEELGDLLMQVLLHSEMASQEGVFTIEDVAGGLNDKLIRRHPHVFGEVKVDGAWGALQSWEKEKAKDKAKAGEALLSSLPRGLPALQRTARMIEKVSKVGFQWTDIRGPTEKLREETEELISEIEKGAEPSRMEEELGDVLFSLCNMAYFLKLSPEDALRGTLARFERRFNFVEARLKEKGKAPENSNMAEMDELWNEAKKQERKK